MPSLDRVHFILCAKILRKEIVVFIYPPLWIAIISNGILNDDYKSTDYKLHIEKKCTEYLLKYSILVYSNR